MSENLHLPEAIRAAKYEAIEEAIASINKLIEDVKKSDKNQPTRSRALEDARRAVQDSARPYWSQKKRNEFNARYKAAKDGGSAGSPAHVSSDMKPGKP